MQDNETKKWLYDSMKSKGYDLGSYEEFDSHADEEDTRKWLYDNGVKSGLELGSYEEFDAGMGKNTSKAGPKAQEVVDEYDSFRHANAQNRMQELMRKQDNEPKPKKTLQDIVAESSVPVEQNILNREPISKAPAYSSKSEERIYRPDVFDRMKYDSSIRDEDASVDKEYTPKVEEKEEDVFENYRNRFGMTQRGTELQDELAQIQGDLHNKYSQEFENTPEYKAIVGKKYNTKEEIDAANKALNDAYNKKYGAVINKEMEPYLKAYEGEIFQRYAPRIQEGLRTVAKNDTSKEVKDLTGEVDDLLEKQHKILRSKGPSSGNAMSALMGSTTYNQSTAKERQELGALEASQRLLEQSQEIIEEAGKKGNTNFFAGLGRGFRDNMDIENFTFGLSEMADSKYLNRALEKAEKGEKLTPAEEKLLEASVVNMATYGYFSSDLGRGYGAGSTTAVSLPFMLEFIANPISGSGNAIAKGLLKFGLKKFGRASAQAAGKGALNAFGRGITSNVGKFAGRLVGDATAALGMEGTTGLGRVAAGTLDRLNENYDYSLDDNGKLQVQKTRDTSIGGAFARSAASTFFENQSEMVFNAFRGWSPFMKAVDRALPGRVGEFMNRIKNSKPGQLYRELKNNPTFKEIVERAQFHGQGEEYLEEVYNNLANVAMGEMTVEDALDLDRNIDTFLGLAPTSVMFGLLGLGSMAADRYSNRRKMRAAFGKMTPEQQVKLTELTQMSKERGNEDIKNFIEATIADADLTPEQKRDEIEYAFELAKRNAIEDLQQEQTLEERAADDAYIQGAEMPVEQRYSANQERIAAEESLREVDENALNTIDRLLADDANMNEVNEVLSGMEEQTATLARDYYNKSVRMNGVVDSARDDAQETEDVFEANLEKAVVTDELGNRTVTTATLMSGVGEEKVQVKVLDNDGTKAVVLMDDGSKKMVSSNSLSNVQTMPADDIVNAYKEKIETQAKEQTAFTIQNHPKTQIPQPGMQIWNGDVPLIITEVIEDGSVRAFPAVLDSKTGQMELKNGSTPIDMSVQESLDLQNDYYNKMDAVVDGVNLLEKQAQNAISPSDGESKVLAEVATQPIPDKTKITESGRYSTESIQPSQDVEQPSPIVMKEDGTLDFVATGKVNSLSYLNAKYKEKALRKIEVTKAAYAKDLEKASVALEKAQTTFDDAPIGREAKAEEALQKAKQAYDNVKRESDFWTSLYEIAKIDAEQPGDKIAEEIRAMGEPMDGRELAAEMLALGRLPLLYSDYKRETGFGENEAKGLFGLFKSKDNGGLSIKKAGEVLMLADQEAGSNFFDPNDANAGRNAILDALSSVRTRGGLIDYVKNNREAMAERERAAEQEYEEEQREAWVQENFGMSYADYITYEEVINDIIQEKALSKDAIQEFYNNFAEELNNWNNGRITEETTINERRSVDSGSESSEGLLSTEQLSDNRGIETDISAEADGRADNKGVPASEESIITEIKDAREQVDTNPSDAQKEAGNYKKGHIKLDGYDITIENSKGSGRSGTDRDGNSWSITMNNDYGYIRGTESVDGDHIDVFLSDNPADGKVYVIDQINEDGSFDEHKVMYGFNSTDEARDAYLSNYSPGWKGLGTISEVSKDEFKKWIDSSHRKTKPFAEYKSVIDELGNQKSVDMLEGGVIDVNNASLFADVDISNGFLKRVGSKPTKKSVYGIRDGKLYLVNDENLISDKLSHAGTSGIKDAFDINGTLRRDTKFEDIAITPAEVKEENGIYSITKRGRIYIGNSSQKTEGNTGFPISHVGSDGMIINEDAAREELEDIEQKWEDRILDYIAEHYPTQATVSAYTNSPEGLKEKEAMKNDETLKRMRAEADAEFNAANEKVLSLSNQGNITSKSTSPQKNSGEVAENLPQSKSAAKSKKRAADIKRARYELMDAKRELSVAQSTNSGYTPEEVEEKKKRVEEAENKLRKLTGTKNGETPTSSVSEIPVMTEEEYLASKGYSFSGIGDVALHKGKQRTGKQQDKVVESQAKKDKNYTERRKMLRKEYRDKLAKGELREPNTIEKLLKAANGNPGNESTQAARRALQKRGIDWQENELKKLGIYDEGVRFRIVHHGTGASFDKFTTEKIGTGEGNAAFGWGLYFTEKKDIAQYYAETIGNMPSYVLYKDGKPADMNDEVSRIIYNYDGDVKKAIRDNKRHAKMWEKEGDKDFASAIMETVSKLQKEDPKAWEMKEEGNRHIYDVEIPDTGFINWDKTVPEEQKKQIQDQAEKEGISFSFYGDVVSPKEYFKQAGRDLEGFQLYKSLTDALGSDKAASLFLNRAGFNGIEYEAGRHSANKKGNEMNFVVFDENAVRIIDHLRYRLMSEQDASNLDKAEEATTRMDNLNVAREMEAAFNAKKERIEKLRKIDPVEITGEEYKGKYELNGDSAQKYILDNLRGEYNIDDTGEKIKISKKGAKKVTSHSQGNEAHMKSIVAIPELIRNSIFIEEQPAYKEKAQYDSYRYYVVGLKIGEEDYTARITIGVKNGEFYYDHYLTEIEKGNLIEVAQSFKPTEDAPNPSYAKNKDSILLSILQTNDKENAKKIKMATGWERGSDGKWRYEEDTNQEQIIQSVEDLSGKLNTPVRIARSLDEISDESAKHAIEEGRKVKAWFDTGTREVFLYIPNADSVDDAIASVLHEIVGHRGLRNLFGTKNESEFDAIMMDLFEKLPLDVRSEIADIAIRRYASNVSIAMDEYLAEQAEKDETPRWWDIVVSAIRDFFRKMGVDMQLSENDVKYLLWRSRKKLESGDLFEHARDVVMRNKLGIDLDETQKASESVPKEGTRFRIVGGIFDSAGKDVEVVERETGNARGMYERTLQTAGYKMRESWQDSMLGLKEAQDAIAKATHSRILDYENAYMAENALSSRSLAEINAYRELVYKPILEEIARMKKLGAKYEDISDYLITKHGIERNREMAVRKALAEDENTVKENIERWTEDKKNIWNNDSMSWKEKQEELDRIAASYGADMSVDYSGLSAMFPSDDMEETTAEAYKAVEDFEGKFETDPLLDKVKAATTATLDKQRDSGLMNKDTYKSIQDMYQFYVPLRGWEEKTADEVYDYITSETPVFNAPLKTAKGRTSKSDDPLPTIANIAESGILQGNRNLMKQKFLTMVENHPSNLVSVSELWVKYDAVNDKWTAIFPEIPNNASAEEVENIVSQFNARMEELSKNNPDEYKKASDARDIPYKILPNNLKEHQVIVKRNGKEYVLTINGNPRAAQALNGLTNPNATDNPVIKAFEATNRFLAANFTQRNPAFVISNMFRDGFYSNSVIWVKKSPLYAKKYNKNWAKSLKEMGGLVKRYKTNSLDMNNDIDRMFLEFINNGGETGYTFINSVEEYKGIIAKELKKQNRSKLAPGKAFDILGEAMDTFGRWAEDTSRFAAYRTSREMGRSIARSISDAKEISVNFNKKGSGAKTAGKWEKGNRMNALQAWTSQTARGLYIFWNAGVQGLTNFARLAKRNPGKFAGLASSYFVLGGMMPVINAALASAMGGDGDEDDYYNLPEYVRRNNICIYMGGEWLTIPLPIELKAIYGLGELACGVLSGKENMTGWKLTKKVAEQVSQIMPIDMMEGGGGFSAFIPSYVKPITEAYVANKDWTGIPIYRKNDFNTNMPEWTKAYSSTSPELVKLSETLNEWTGGTKYKKGMINFNPARVEHLFESYLGGVGTTINQLKKTAMMPFNEDLQELRNAPVLSRFMRSADSRSVQKRIDEEYFNNRDRFELIRQEVNGYKKELENPQTNDFDYAKYQTLYNKMINNDEYRKYIEFKEMDKVLKKMRDAFKQSGNEELEAQMFLLKEAMNEVTK